MSFSRLLGETPVCPICEGPCREELHRGSWAIGMPMPDHPTAIIAPRDVYDHGVVKFVKGQPVPYSEAIRLGVIKIPPPPKVKKGKRKPAEDRMRHGPIEDR